MRIQVEGDSEGNFLAVEGTSSDYVLPFRLGSVQAQNMEKCHFGCRNTGCPKKSLRYNFPRQLWAVSGHFGQKCPKMSKSVQSG